MASTGWFLYDGDCAFCSASAGFLERHVGGDARVVAWQFADLPALGLTAAQCDQAVQWVSRGADGRRDTASGPAAIAAYLRRGGAFWRVLGLLLGTRPMLTAGAPVYAFVARHRDRMPGGTATCALPAERRVDDRPGTGPRTYRPSAG